MNAMSTAPALLNRRAAAALMGVCPATLVKWRREGRGPRPLRLTDGPRGRAVYRREEVEEWIADPQAYERRHPRSWVSEYPAPPRRR